MCIDITMVRQIQACYSLSDNMPGSALYLWHQIQCTSYRLSQTSERGRSSHSTDPCRHDVSRFSNSQLKQCIVTSQYVGRRSCQSKEGHLVAVVSVGRNQFWNNWDIQELPHSTSTPIVLLKYRSKELLKYQLTIIIQHCIDIL